MTHHSAVGFIIIDLRHLNQQSAVRLDYFFPLKTCPKFISLQTVGIIFKHKRREDRFAAVSKAITVVRQRTAEVGCLLDLQWKANEQRIWAKLFFFWPASSNSLLFFPLFFSIFVSINVDGREEEEEEKEGNLYYIEKTEDMSRLPFTGCFYS